MSSNLPVMKISPEVFRGPWLKAERANKHINEILSASQAIPEEWFDFSVKPRTIPPQKNPSRFELTYTPLKPVPEFFALMIGDAVHNLRAALDHLATGIIRTQKPAAELHFPICKNRDDLINNRGMATRLSDMEAALPGTKKLILDKIRPVNDARDHLWSFHVVNNDDKHNLIIPIVSVANIGGINAKIGGSTFRDCGAGNDAAKPFVAISSDIPFALQGNPKATVDVSFGPGTPFDGEPVIQTLLDISHIVGETIQAFADLALS